jgi:hypothetical protein
VAAADDFPRGLWLFSRVAASGTATVTFPAFAQGAWVLTDVEASLFASPATTAAAEISDSAGRYYAAVAVNNLVPVDHDDASWSGTVAFPINTLVTVSFSAPAITGTVEYLRCRAFPI